MGAGCACNFNEERGKLAPRASELLKDEVLLPGRRM